MAELQDRQEKSRVAPTFSKRDYNKLKIADLHEKGWQTYAIRRQLEGDNGSVL